MLQISSADVDPTVFKNYQLDYHTAFIRNLINCLLRYVTQSIDFHTELSQTTTKNWVSKRGHVKRILCQENHKNANLTTI